MADDIPPVVGKTTTTAGATETTKATTEASAAAVISPPPNPIADDNARKVLALAVVAQFLALLGYMIYQGKPIENMQLIVGAEISFVTTVLNYYFGSSSGSTSKQAALDAKNK